MREKEYFKAPDAAGITVTRDLKITIPPCKCPTLCWDRFDLYSKGQYFCVTCKKVYTKKQLSKMTDRMIQT